MLFWWGALGVMEAIQKLLHPSHEVKMWLLYWYFNFGLLVEGSSLRAMKSN